MKTFSAFVLALLATAAGGTAVPLSGEVVLRTIGEDKLAVLVDTDHDQKIDQGFLLSSDLPLASLNVSFKSAHLEFNDAYVRLVSDDEIYDLYVAGHPEPPPAPRDLRTVRYIGYALQHTTGDSRCTLTQAREGDAGTCYSFGKN